MMNEREKVTVMVLESQLAALRTENAELKLEAECLKNISLKKEVADLKDAALAALAELTP